MLCTVHQFVEKSGCFARSFVSAVVVLLALSNPVTAGLLRWEFGFRGTENNFSGYGFIELGEVGPRDAGVMEWDGVCGYTNNDAAFYNDCFPYNWTVDNTTSFAQYDINFQDLTFNDLYIFGYHQQRYGFGDLNSIYYTLTITEDALTLTCSSYFEDDYPDPRNCNGGTDAFRSETFASGEAYIRFTGNPSGYEIPEPNPLGISLTDLAALSAMFCWGKRPRNFGTSGSETRTRSHGASLWVTLRERRYWGRSRAEQLNVFPRMSWSAARFR